DHNRQILVTLAVAELVDPDPLQPRKQIRTRKCLIRQPSDDTAHCPPAHAHQLRNRCAIGVHRQPATLLLKLPREAATRPSPRYFGNHHSVLRTAHSHRLRFEVNLHRPQIQSPPPPST